MNQQENTVATASLKGTTMQENLSENEHWDFDSVIAHSSVSSQTRTNSNEPTRPGGSHFSFGFPPSLSPMNPSHQKQLSIEALFKGTVDPAQQSFSEANTVNSPKYRKQHSMFGPSYDTATKDALDSILAEVNPESKQKQQSVRKIFVDNNSHRSPDSPKNRDLNDLKSLLSFPKHQTVLSPSNKKTVSPYPENIDDIVDSHKSSRFSSNLISSSSTVALCSTAKTENSKYHPTPNRLEGQYINNTILVSSMNPSIIKPAASAVFSQNILPISRKASSLFSFENISTILTTPTTAVTHSPRTSVIIAPLSMSSPSKQRPKKLFEIRNMNPNSKKAFSAMMDKLGEKCNMRFNEEKQVWEGIEGSKVEDSTGAVEMETRVREIGMLETIGADYLKGLCCNPSDGDNNLWQSGPCGYKQKFEKCSFAGEENMYKAADVNVDNFGFLSKIDSAMDSLAQIEASLLVEATHFSGSDDNAMISHIGQTCITEATTINNDFLLREQNPLPSRHAVAQPASQALKRNNPKLMEIVSLIIPEREYWPNTFDLNIDQVDLQDIFGFDQFMPNLLRLSMRSNNVTYLDGLPTGLTTLILIGNRISNITSFSHLKSLRYLDISQNSLSNLDPLKSLIELCELNVSGNLISEIEFTKLSDF
ncbi:hypothetical protein HK100_002840 [Physocladia obscura]|uniref:Uncharacterized protein n=1 Tax=Physocladia obscura TaxID=109957 RepID=A0AAD5XF48_9FUNG|nr:hypothetical protein HK100_002840 [Physocladia obscura]